jgi:hypothetical protein
MSRIFSILAIAGSLIAASALSVSAVAGEKQEGLFETSVQSSAVSSFGTATSLRQIGTGTKQKRQIGTGTKQKRQIGTGVKQKRQIGTGVKQKRQIGTGRPTP